MSGEKKKTDLEQALSGEGLRLEIVAPPEMHNPRKPNYEIQSEKPWHRILAYKMAMGHSVRRCAEELHKTPEHIRDVAKQAWFQRNLETIVHEQFEDDIIKLIQGATVESVLTLVDLQANAQSETVRANAAKSLLDTYFKHRPDDSTEEATDPQAELAALQREREELQRQLGYKDINECVEKETGEE